ncbi:MAG: DUF2235 domain-containing protein [Xanthobacteraceae bacterium]
MKRIVVLIDGTWEQEGVGKNTNVGLLDADFKIDGFSLIKSCDKNGVRQVVEYHKGVGAATNPVQHYLGGLIGEGLRNLVLDAYSSLAKLYEPEDEIYVVGFSRGAYAARALVGMIGASGIVRSPDNAEIAWAYYRVSPAARSKWEQPSQTDAKAIRELDELRNQGKIHADNRVKCVGVWETVGSYGVPAGFHLGFIARFIAMERLGFHDTSFGNHVDVGLHAVGIDEHRRPFVPTFWTIAKGQQPAGIVEQTWFAGEHGNVGGGEANTGLSTQALVWMIARIHALTSLEFDLNAVTAIAKQVDVDGEVYDSTVGWPLDHLWPHFRRVLSPDAIEHGALMSTIDTSMEHINEKVHWSVLRKRGRPCIIYGKPNAPYAPPNLPPDIPVDKIAELTTEEKAILSIPS